MPIVPALPSFNLVAGLTFVGGDPVVAGGRQVGSGVDVRRFHAGAWEPPSVFTTARPGSLVMIPGKSAVLIGETTFDSGRAFGHVTRFAFP